MQDDPDDRERPPRGLVPVARGGRRSSPPTPATRHLRGLHEQGTPEHRLRVEHDAHMMLVNLGDETAATTRAGTSASHRLPADQRLVTAV